MIVPDSSLSSIKDSDIEIDILAEEIKEVMKGVDVSAISEVDDEDVFTQKPAPVGGRDTLVEVEGQLSESTCKELAMLPKS